MDLKPKTLEKLQYFKSKVCSIITTAMNRNFDEKIAREHFVTMVEDVTADGIWGSHPYNPQMFNFYFMDRIVSIHEEAVLDPDNPEHAQMLSDFEQKTGQKAQGDLKKPAAPSLSLPVLSETPPVQDSTDGDAAFVDIEQLEALAEHSKNQFDAYDKYQSIQAKMLPQ